MTDKVNIQVVFYGMYGHVCRMAEAIAEVACSVPGIGLFQVPEPALPGMLERKGLFFEAS